MVSRAVEVLGQERGQRLESLIQGANEIFDEAVVQHILDEGKQVAAVVLLFTGGHDSTSLAHLFRGRATHVGHANTGVGVEVTRVFVRETAAAWGLPVLEFGPRAGETYHDLVRGECRARTGPHKGTVVWPGGFPGPAGHGMMYQRLKERAFEQIRNAVVDNPRRQRVVFVAGRRRSESARRQGVPASERRGSTVWISPLIHWDKSDLAAYREVYDVPRNEVADLLHMSGECLCGAFAHRNELAEIELWFPEDVAPIRALERELLASGKFPPSKCVWGWGAGSEPPCSACRD